jgi:arylsulfatase
VLVLSDTLRRDALGLYGGSARTPRTDRFARENLHFAAANSQAPWTKPAMATLFTGLYPSQHGVLSHPKLRGRGGAELRVDAVSEELVTLAEVLRDAGYETAAFVANPWLERRFGFAQGFETYDDSFASNRTPGTRVNEAALDWLDTRSGGRPYFLYLHYMDAHAPYPPIPVERLRERLEALRADRRPLPRGAARHVARMARLPDGRSAVAAGVPPSRPLLRLAYDMGVEQFDGAFGRLLDGLVERGERPGIVLTSDHGEALLERGWVGHGFGLFGDELDIPLVLALPGVERAGAVECPVGLVDVMASVCTYLGVACPEHDFGRSVLRPAGGTRAPEAGRWLVSEGVKNKDENRAIRGQRYKLLFEPEGRIGPPRPPRSGYSLFDLGEDPDEERNLLAEGAPSDEVLAAFRVLKAQLPVTVPAFAGPAPGVAPMGDETAERLKSLGYLE